MIPMSIVKMFVAYILCLIYSFLALILLMYSMAKRYNAEYWFVKPRKIPPKCLTDPIYGNHSFMQINGIKLHFVEKGDRSKPLMLFIHGFPEFWYSWRYQLKEFSKDYRVIALDLRGYGDSEKPSMVSAYKIENITEDIKCFIEALNYKKCILIAHDWGAVIGWKFITKHMDLIDKYIMMDAPSMDVWAKSITSDMKQFLMSWYVFFFQMPMLPEYSLAFADLRVFKTMKSKQHDNSNNNNNTFTDEDLEAYKYTFSKPGALTPPINYYRANLNFNLKNEHTKLNEYAAAGLYLLGEHDNYISKTSGEQLQKHFKNLDFKIVKNANHFIQQDAPSEVNRLIREFLSRN